MNTDWNDLDHVIDLPANHPLPDIFTMNLFESHAGPVEEQNYNHNAPGSFQSADHNRQGSKSTPHHALQPVQTSLPLPPGCPIIDADFIDYSQNLIPQDLSLQNMIWLPNSIPCSSTSSVSIDMPGLTSSSSASESIHSYAVPPPHMHLHPSRRQSRKISSRSSSSFSDTPIKLRKAKSKAVQKVSGAPQPKQALRQLEESIRSRSSKVSKKFSQHSQLLLAQLRLLVEKEIEDGNLEAELDEMSTTASSTLYQSRESEPMDSVYPTKELTDVGSSVTSIPRPLTIENFNSAPADTRAQTKVRYYCTFPNCMVQQKECKHKHKKCPCPAQLQRFWSESKVDIKRHEERLEHWPQETFICIKCFVAVSRDGNTTCRSCYMSILEDPDAAKTHYSECERARMNTKTFSRKDHLLGHLQNQHELRNMGELTKAWSIRVGRPWPRQCGFCPVIFDSWDQRMSHIAWHFEHGFKIENWSFPPAVPMDKKPPGSFFPNCRKYDDDDSNDDTFSDSRGNMQGKLTSYTPFASTTIQNQHTASSSTQQYRSRQDQGHYQHSYDATSYTAGKEHVVMSAPSSIKVSIALERYLEDSGDRVPGLGTAPLGFSELQQDFQGHKYAFPEPCQTLGYFSKPNTRIGEVSHASHPYTDFGASSPVVDMLEWRKLKHSPIQKQYPCSRRKIRKGHKRSRRQNYPTQHPPNYYRVVGQIVMSPHLTLKVRPELLLTLEIATGDRPLEISRGIRVVFDRFKPIQTRLRTHQLPTKTPTWIAGPLSATQKQNISRVSTGRAILTMELSTIDQKWGRCSIMKDGSHEIGQLLRELADYIVGEASCGD